MIFNEWSKADQAYCFEYDGVKLRSNSPIEVIAPLDMIPPEPPPAPPVKSFKNKFSNMQFAPEKNMDRMNHGLGVPQRQVKEKLVVMEGETGRKLEEVGNEKPTADVKDMSYKITRNEVDHIKNTVK